MAYIKNISHEEVLHLADQVSADKGQIVSKTLAQNDHVSVTLFAFSKDEEIATHDSTGDASNPVLYMVVSVFALVMCAFIVLRRRTDR